MIKVYGNTDIWFDTCIYNNLYIYMYSYSSSILIQQTEHIIHYKTI